MPNYTISVYLDTRRKKEGEVYPVKLRVYHNYKSIFISTGISLSKNVFKKSYLAEKPRGEFKDIKNEILIKLSRANSVADQLKVFSLVKFERELFGPIGANTNVVYQYELSIKRFRQEDQIKTASNYEMALNSILSFLFQKGKYQKLKDEIMSSTDYQKQVGNKFSIKHILLFVKQLGRNLELDFEEVNPAFLKHYERWMTGEGKSLTTISMYLRTLRTIFNEAINNEEIDKDSYPFKKNLYCIPSSINIKKALTKEELKKLFQYELDTECHMYKARAFWFFSYQANGMNIRDICELKQKHNHKDIITFIRTKTKRTSKSNLKPIVIVKTRFIEGIIKEFGNTNQDPESYIFPIFTAPMSETEKVRRTEAFTRFINQHIKKLAKQVGVDPNISTYYARHSFTTISVQNGATLEFIQESLGHSSIKTTMNYWAGFSDSVKKENALKLMDFD